MLIVSSIKGCGCALRNFFIKSSDVREELMVKYFMAMTIVAINILRKSQLLYEPRFYAEEGQSFFSFAYNHTLLEYALTPMYGYYALYNVIATSIATLFNLEIAPLITTYQALLVQIFVSVFVIWGDIPILNTNAKRFLVAILLPLICPSQIWLTTIGVQYWLCILTVLILLEGNASKIGTVHAVKALLLIVAGLTGVLSCMITPIFLIKWIQCKSKQFLLYASVLCICSTIQLLIFTSAYISHDNDLNNRLTVPVSITNIAGQFITDDRLYMPVTIADRAYSHTLCLLGGLFVNEKSDYLDMITKADIVVNKFISNVFKNTVFSDFELIYLLASILIIMVIITTSKRNIRSADYIYILLTAVIVYLLSLEFSVGGIGGPRYMFSPRAMIMVALVASCSKSSVNTVRNIIITGCISAIILCHTMTYVSSMDRVCNDNWPRWADEVHLWRMNNDHPLKIWPPSWQMHLTKQATSNQYVSR